MLYRMAKVTGLAVCSRSPIRDENSGVKNGGFCPRLFLLIFLFF